MTTVWSPEAWPELRAIVPDLTDRACVRSWRCWTCLRCTEAYGLIGILDIALYGADRSLPGGDGGGYHLELEFDGVPRQLGGKCASVVGLTAEEAWSNLVRALS